jgi:hypothetical protein
MKNIFLILFGFYCLQAKSQTCSISPPVNQICIGQSSTLTFTHDLPIGSTILWDNNSSTSSITVNPNATTLYSCTVENGTSTCTASVTITVNAIPTISSILPNSRCDAGTISLSATPSAGVVNWYATSTGGTSLNSGNTYSPNISATTLFYVDATNNGCTSPRTAVTATVNQTPTLSAVNNQSLCAGDNSTAISFSSNISGSTISWDNTNNAIGLASSGSGNIPSFSTINNTTSNATASISATSSVNGCTSSPITVVLTIKPKPTLLSVSSQTICAGNNSTAITFSSNIAGSTFSWSNTNTLIGLSGNGNGNIASFTTINNSNTNAVAAITASATANGCTSNSISFNITVKPKPNIANQNFSFCSSTNYTSNWTGVIPTNTFYTWNVTNNTQVIGETNNNVASAFSQILTNLTLLNQTVVYSITPIADACVGSPFILNLEVKPSPPANAGQDFTKTCLANTNGNTIGSASIPGFTYSWLPSSNLSSSIAANPIANPNSTTQYTVTVVDLLSNCSAKDSVIVTVNNSIPIINAGIDGTISCLQNSSGYTIGVSPTANISYSWNPVNGLASSNSSSTVANPNTTTTYTLNAINLSNGCPSSDLVTVIIDKTPPTVTAGSDFTKTCISNVFGNSIGMSALPNVTYSWSPSTSLTASNIANPIANPTSTTTYELTATSSVNGCAATDQVVVSVNQNAPLSNAGSDFTKTCTSNQNGNTIGMNAVAGINYSWLPSTGLTPNNIANPLANPSQTTLFTLTSTDPSNGCTSSDQVLVTVNNSAPTAYAGLDATITCSQNTNGAVIGMPPVSGITYSWTPNNGLTSSNQSEVIANPNGNTTYSLTATNTSNGCVSSDAVSVNIDLTPPLVNAGNDLVICQGEQVSLNGTSNGAQVNWTPSFLVQNPNQLSTLGDISGTTTFTLIATGNNGCVAQDFITAEISSIPVSGLNTSYEICQNETLDLIVNSGVTCSWSGIYTGVGNSVSIGGLESGLLNLNLTNNDGCTASETISVVVNPIPYPVISGSGEICQNSYWEKYSISPTSNFLHWSIINGEFQSDSTTNEVYVHWDSINPLNQITSQITITETVASTGCHNSFVKNILLDTTAALNPANILALSTNVLYSTQDYTFMNWGYESILTHIPVSVGVYSQYCEFNNLDVSNYNYWVEIGDGNGCITKSYYNEPIYSVDLEYQDFAEFKVFPNPTENMIYVHTNLKSSLYKIQTLNGSVVKTGVGTDEFSINVIDLPSGVYFLNVNNGLTNYQTKIVKL